MYSLRFNPNALRIFKRLPKDVQQEMIEQAQVLTSNPMQGEQLKGKYRLLRSRHFSYKGIAYRMIYQVVAQADTILVVLADKRENIYKRLEHMGI